MTCIRTSLAGTPGFGSVEQCSCGSIHVTVGAVTLRLMPSALSVFADLLVAATTRVSALPVSDDDAPEAWS
jgi:hypothetical protein